MQGLIDIHTNWLYKLTFVWNNDPTKSRDINTSKDPEHEQKAEFLPSALERTELCKVGEHHWNGSTDSKKTKRNICLRWKI